MALSRFRQAKTAKEEVNLVQKYKSKWAHGIFKEWQRQRLVKVPIVEVVGLFKNYDFHQVESLETPLVDMSPLSVNYLLAYEICPRCGKAFKRVLPSENLVRRH